MNLETRGEALAAVLNEAIDDMVDDDLPRSEVIAQMAEAAGIDADTVNEILNATIDCPPLDRLEGFAEVLDVSLQSLIEAAAEDGCSYDDDEERLMNLEESIREITNEAGIEAAVPIVGAVQQLAGRLDQSRQLTEEIQSALAECGAPEGSSEVAAIRWLVNEVARLRPLADDGRTYRADLIDEAIAEGIRALGDGFNQETYRGLLEASSLAVIKRMRADWKAIGDKRFAGGALVQETEEATTVLQTPDQAYAS